MMGNGLKDDTASLTPWQKRELESMELHFQLFTVLRLAAQKKKLAEKDPEGPGVEEDDDESV